MINIWAISHVTIIVVALCIADRKQIKLENVAALFGHHVYWTQSNKNDTKKEYNSANNIVFCFIFHVKLLLCVIMYQTYPVNITKYYLFPNLQIPPNSINFSQYNLYYPNWMRLLLWPTLPNNNNKCQIYLTKINWFH